MTKWIKPVAMALIFILVSCEADFLPGVEGEGPIVEIDLLIGEFDEIENFTFADVLLSEGDDFAVRVSGQENIIAMLNTQVKSDTWKIDFDDWIRKSDPVVIHITLPELKRFELAGSGDLQTTNTLRSSRDLELKISGSGDADLTIDHRELDLVISGSGNIELSGKSDQMNLKISGSGDVDSYKMDLEEAQIKITGSGQVSVFAADLLDIDISGSGDVYYRGKPRIHSTITGSGSIIDDN